MHFPERFSEDPADYVVQRAPQPTLPGLRCERILEGPRQCSGVAECEQQIGRYKRLLCLQCGVWIASGTPRSGVKPLGLEGC